MSLPAGSTSPGWAFCQGRAPEAEAKVTKVTLSQPASFDEETVKKLVPEAIAFVPGGSTDVQVVSQEKNPLMIERKETFLVTLSYNFHGDSYSRSILFLNRAVTNKSSFG